MKRFLACASAAVVAALLGVSPVNAQTNPVWPYPGQSAGPAAPLDTALAPATQVQFIARLPIPVDYTADKTTFTTPQAWDYYEIQYAPVTAIGPWVPPGVAAAQVPAGTQWLGLCQPGTYNATTNRCADKAGNPTYLYTPVWGYGQVNSGGGPLGGAASYPSMNIRATKGTPVKVKWVNNLPDQHLFCAQPTNSNWPCAIDRTLMGTKASLPVAIPGIPNFVTSFGGPQQPDNAVVVHLHGGDIPPEADGFAEFWTGNVNTSSAYSPGAVPVAIDPALSLYNGGGAATPLVFFRPIGNSAIYNYPMVQDAMMIWFHDHALGKTRINVAAGPAGFFQVNDPAAEPPGCSTVKVAGTACLPDKQYEINIAFQDRSFNAPQPGSNLASINYPNALNWAQVAPVAFQTPLTPGGNPTVHPQWVPEYFGDVPIVNGMAWPFHEVEPRMYRLHLLGGSNARCWRISRSDGVSFAVIGTDQGYLTNPVNVGKLVICPGERYDTIWDFTGLAKKASTITVLNNAPAPFPKGIAPTVADVAKVMQFRVNQPLNTAVPNGPLPKQLVPASMNAPLIAAGAVPCAFDPAVGGQGLHTKVPAGATSCVPMRQKILNEQLDATTLFPLRVQIDGSAFEDAITERPVVGTTEVWRIVNTTGDAHPIHTHLVRHQIVSRQNFDLAGFSLATNFAVPIPLPGMAGPDGPPVCAVGTAAGTAGCFNLGVDVAGFVNGGMKAPPAYEAGWKDTSISYPGEVLTIVAKWEGHWNTATPDPANPAAPAFLPVTSGPYVWHCHIVDHEDNEMMRPVLLQ